MRFTEYRIRSLGAWIALIASLCPWLALFLCGMANAEFEAVLVPAFAFCGGLGALGNWWFTTAFHMEPTAARACRWSLRAAALVVFGAALILVVDKFAPKASRWVPSSDWAVLSMMLSALAGALLKAGYLRVYFGAHRDRTHTRAANFTLGLYAGSIGSVIILAVLGSLISTSGAWDGIALCFGALALIASAAAYITTCVLLGVVGKNSRPSHVEWWLKENALPDRDWAAVLWCGLGSAEIVQSDGARRRFDHAVDAVSWLYARSYVDRNTALSRELVSMHEVPPQPV